MRYNISFSLTKGNKTENKFESIDHDFQHNSVAGEAKKILEEKYKGYTVEVTKTGQVINATGGVV